MTMDIHEAIAKHPNLLNNYRRAALHKLLARDMAKRGDNSNRRDMHLVSYGFLLGTAQGYLFSRYGKVIRGEEYTEQLSRYMEHQS